MAKKVRKPRASNPRTYAEMPNSASAPAAPAAPASTGKAVSAVQGAAAPKKVDLAAEYAVVGGDLRRLLVTAGVMFAVLIAVNVVITLVR